MKSDSDVDADSVVPSDSREIPLLTQIIRNEIETVGPITFARFMELALYHPEHGYYASGRARIGRRGDFFTNVSVGPVFGKLLAAQFGEIWEKLKRPERFTIVEQGAHDGQFAADVLGALRTRECFSALHYLIVEPFPIWRERQRETLESFGGKISWFEAIDQLQRFTGVHFSNELFDSVPVHLFGNAKAGSQEVLVELDGDKLKLQGRDSCAPREVSRTAPKLMRRIANKLSCGVILTIDYGHSRGEFSARSAGTLQVRAQHRKLSGPLEQIGLADISAHVDWTSLIEAAESAGAQLIGLTDQHHFLTGILTPLLPTDHFSAADKRALQTLIHPEILGRSFQALALGKNFTSPLSGFRFARDLS